MNRYDLNDQATTMWFNLPSNIESNVNYGGSTRRFENVRNAVRFVIEELPPQQSASADIITDLDVMIRIGEIREVYIREFKA
jgi:hypothetical protein